MDAVPPGPYQPPPRPGDLDAPTPGPQVSTAGYWIAGVVLVLGVGGAVVWFVISIVSVLNVADGFDRIGVPGRTSLDLDSGEWVVYHEYRGAGSGSYLVEPEVVVTGPDGRAVAVDHEVQVSATYVTAGGSEGVSIARFVAGSPGPYQVEVFGEPSPVQRIAVGRSIGESIEVGGVLGSIALGLVAVVVAVVIFVVTLARRGRTKRTQPAAPPPLERPWAPPPVAPPASTPRPVPPPPGTSPWAPPGEDRQDG
jgi:hypothetical protein